MTDLADTYRALADAVEQLGDVSTIDIDEADLLERDEDKIRATVTITAPVPTAGGADVEATTVDEPVSEDQAAGTSDADNADEDLDEDDPFAEVHCDVDGCDYSGTKQGLAIHEGRAHAEDGREEAAQADEQPNAELEGDYVCDDCGETFESEHGLNIHRGHRHDGGGESTEDVDDDTDELEETADDDVDGESEESIADRRDYDEDLVVEDLNEVSEVRGRSMRQQIRSADEDASDEDLAVEIGATVDVVRELRDEVAALEARTDGGDVTIEPSGASTSVACQNCDSHVTQEYVDVFAPDGVDNPRVCPFCPDMVREHDGSVREARSTRSKARGVDR